MKSATSRKMFVFALALALTVSVAAAQQNQAQPAQPAAPAQAQMAPAGAPPSPCANRPLCYDSNDFVASVTEFRTSTAGNGAKILDALVHFQNKTNQSISLGYVDGSGGAIDDMGNRFVLSTYNGGVRGIGVVAGNNMDPKFTLPAGGSGDARFELWWAPYGKLAGVNYEMEFSIREMNRVEGNQWTLGDEALIHYQGLANGMGVAPVSGNSFASSGGGVGSGTAGSNGGVVSSVGSAVSAYVPGQANNSGQAVQTTYVAAGQPCPAGTAPSTSRAANIASAVGQQNQTANNAISNATSAISSFGSIFKKKNANANANAAPAGTTPCVATATGAVATNPALSASPAAVANPATAAPGAVNPAVRTTAVRSTTSTAPVATRQATSPAVARPTNTQPAGAVTKATLRQPVVTQPATGAATSAAKPSPVRPATKKPATATTSTTTTTQGH